MSAFCLRGGLLDGSVGWGRGQSPRRDVYSVESFLKDQVRTKSLQSCPTLCNPMAATHQAPLSMGFSRKNIGVGLPFSSPRDRRLRISSQLFHKLLAGCLTSLLSSL